MVFTNEEEAGMLLISGESRGNFAAAERLHRERFLNRQHQSRSQVSSTKREEVQTFLALIKKF